MKIVSCSPTVTDTVVALGAESMLAARSDQCDASPRAASLPSVGPFGRPRAEEIISLAPDLVMAHAPFDLRAAAELTRAGIALKVFAPKNIDDIIEDIGEMGRLTGTGKAAWNLTRGITARVSTARRAVSGVAPGRRPTVLRILEPEPVLVPGPGSFMTSLARAAGGIPPDLGPGPDYREISLERLKSLDPDFIYFCGDSQVIATELPQLPGWSELKAVRRGQVLVFPCRLTCRPGHRAGLFVRALTAALFPERIGPEPKTGQ